MDSSPLLIDKPNEEGEPALDCRGAAAQKADDQDDHRKQKKNVDEPAADVNGKEPKGPQNDQNNNDGFQH